VFCIYDTILYMGTSNIQCKAPDHIFPCTIHPDEILTHGVRKKLQQGKAVAFGAYARLYTVVAI